MQFFAHQCILKYYASANGRPPLNHFKTMSNKERLCCFSHIRRHFVNAKQLGFFVNMFHQQGPNTLSRMAARDEEMVYVTTRLNVCVCHNCFLMLDDKRKQISHMASPQLGVDICWRPCFYLLWCVVS